MKYYSEKRICKCGFMTYSKIAWRNHALKENEQTQLTLRGKCSA